MSFIVRSICFANFFSRRIGTTKRRFEITPFQPSIVFRRTVRGSRHFFALILLFYFQFEVIIFIQFIQIETSILLNTENACLEEKNQLRDKHFFFTFYITERVKRVKIEYPKMHHIN